MTSKNKVERDGDDKSTASGFPTPMDRDLMMAGLPAALRLLQRALNDRGEQGC